MTPFEANAMGLPASSVTQPGPQVSPPPTQPFMAKLGTQLQPQTAPTAAPTPAAAPTPTPSISDAQKAALTGYGTALSGAPVALHGQTFGNNTDLQSWYDNFNKQFPDAQATLKNIQGSEGQDMGYTVNIGNYNALPTGWQKAMTGPTGGVEMSDPTSHWTGQTISDQGINKDPIWGTSTSMNNIKQPKDVFNNVIGPMIVSMMIGGAAGGMFPGMAGMSSLGGMGSVLGNVGMSAANSLVRTGGINPLGLATSAVGGLTGIPSGLLNMGVGLAQGQKPQAPSVMSALPLIARLGTQLGNG